MDGAAVRRAIEGVHVAYYLIHSLGTGASFEQRDRDAAGIFADAALSAGERSHGEVGDVLLGSCVPTAALQAALIVGSGSASFEMLHHLTERLPVTVTPKWVRTRIQPISVRDVLRYLVGSAAVSPDVNRPFDIGGPDVVTYAEMMPVLRRRRAAAARSDSRAAAHTPALVSAVRPGDASARRPGQADGRITQERGGESDCLHRYTCDARFRAQSPSEPVLGPRPAGAADPLIPRVRGGWVRVQVNDP